MMKKYSLALLMMMLSQQVFAEGVWGSLRDLRGTLHEITGTAREVQQLSKEAGISQDAITPGQQPATENLQPGDILYSKITNQAVYREADKKAPLLMRASKADELVFTGTEANGFLHVATDKGEGWVDKILVKKN